MTEWIVTSSAMILVIIGLRGLLKGKISLRLQYALWAVVLVRLLLPLSIVESAISVSNWLTAPVVREADAAVEEYQQSLDAVWEEFLQSGETPPEQEIEQKVQQELYDRTYERIEQEYAQAGQTVPAVQIETETRKQVERISLTARITQVLPYLWVGGMVLMAAVLLISNLHFAWKLRRTRKAVDLPGVPLKVYLTDCVATPCLFGLLRPCIYLTEEIMTDEKMQRHVITHEMSHYREKDHIWSVLRCVCLVLHWYNPLVWVAAVLSKQDAELSCDERTIRALGEENRAEYGRTLIGMTCVRRDPKALMLTATTMLGTKKALKERIKLIAKKPKAALYTLLACLVVVAVAVGCTFTGAPGETKDPTDETMPTEPSTEPTGPVDFMELSEKDLIERCREALTYIQNLEHFQIAERQIIEPDSDEAMLAWENGRYLHTGDDWFHSYIRSKLTVKYVEKDGSLYVKQTNDMLPAEDNPYFDWTKVEKPEDLYAGHCWILDMGWNEDGTIYQTLSAGKHVWKILSATPEEAWNREIIHLKLDGVGEGEKPDSEVLSFRFDTATGKVMGVDRVVQNGDSVYTNELVITAAKAEEVGAIINDCWKEITGEKPGKEPEETKPADPLKVNPLGILDLSGMPYSGIPDGYLCFIYDPNADNQHIGKETVKQIESNNLPVGCLYSFHGNTNTLYTVLDEPVLGLITTERYLFSLTATNTIVVTDIFGKMKLELYRGEEPIQPLSLDYLNGILYFVEGSKVRNLDLRTGFMGTLTTFEGAFDAGPLIGRLNKVAEKYPVPHLLYFRTTPEEYVFRNLLTGETAIPDTEDELIRFFEDGTWPEKPELTVEYFTQLLTSSKGYWYHRIMGCIFEDSSEISLEHMFYTGMELIPNPEGSGFVMNQLQHADTFTSSEAAFLKAQVEERYGDMAPMFDAIKLPRERVEAVLKTCLGVALKDVEIPDRWVYFEQTDAYYDFRSDSYSMEGQKITDVVVSSDGTIYVYWTAPKIWDAENEYSIKNPQMVMTLRRSNDGSFLVLSNVLK